MAGSLFIFKRSGDITPGITRRAQTHQARRLADESRAIRGRVHAVVRCGMGNIPQRFLLLFG